MENSESKEVRVPVIEKQQPIIIQKPKTNYEAVIGFTCSLLNVFLFWVPILGLVLCIISFVSSLVGLSKEPKGLAIAGTIISVIMAPIVFLSNFFWSEFWSILTAGF